MCTLKGEFQYFSAWPLCIQICVCKLMALTKTFGIGPVDCLRLPLWHCGSGNNAITKGAAATVHKMSTESAYFLLKKVQIVIVVTLHLSIDEKSPSQLCISSLPLSFFVRALRLYTPAQTGRDNLQSQMLHQHCWYQNKFHYINLLVNKALKVEIWWDDPVAMNEIKS